jgi:hypothetical protein
MAPEVGLEPTTLRLTAECSAIELLRSVVEREKLTRNASTVITNTVKGVKDEIAAHRWWRYLPTQKNRCCRRWIADCRINF